MKKFQAKYNIVGWLIASSLLVSCGLKGNPVPLHVPPDYRQAVQNISATTASDNAVQLSWNFENKNERITKIHIEKSEVGTKGNECKDCPRTYERIGQLTIKNLSSENGKLDFTDKKVVKGNIYTYRLILCDDAGICQESSTTEIYIK